MTENENQKLDLLIKMFEQQSRRIDQIESDRRADRAEWKAAREEDRAETTRQFEQMEQTRKEDRAEIARQFEQMEQARKEDQAEWKAARETDRAEWKAAREEDRAEIRNFFKELKEENKEIKHDLRLDKEKLQEVYNARDYVSVRFTRAWASASFFIALIASTIVLAVIKAF